MSKSISIALSLLLVPCAAFAQQPTPTIQMAPIQKTSPASGQQMFVTYCAVCHGANGNGRGPAIAALKFPPADLTALSQKNRGVFPTYHVSAVLQFGVQNPAHGNPEMPIWGDLLSSVNASSLDGGQGDTKQRIYNLIE